MSSLVRALELSGQDSAQTLSRSDIPPRSRNPPSGPSRFSPTSQSKFSPVAPQPTQFSPPPQGDASAISDSPSKPKPTRFETKSLKESSPSERPVATSNSEFRFGSNRPRPSSRITFIPQDRGERFSRPLLPHQAAALAGKISKPPKPVAEEQITPKSKPSATSKPKSGNADEYTYDEYYDDYYYYDDKQANDSEKRGNQPEDLGPIDPPMTKESPQQSITPETHAVKLSDEFTSNQRFSTTTPRPKSENRSSSGRPSLSELLASRSDKEETNEASKSNDLQSSRDGRILSHLDSEKTTVSSTDEKFLSTTARTNPIITTEPRVEVRVTNSTESTVVVANIQTSRSVSMRHEETHDSTTPTIDLEPTLGTDYIEGKHSDVSQPSLTSIFGNIDVLFNDSVDEFAEHSSFSPKSDAKTKVIDITTEAEKLSTTEKTDLPAFLDSIFEKPVPLDPSILPPGFSLAEKLGTSSTTERVTSTSLAKKLKARLSATTPRSEDNLVDGNFNNTDDVTETTVSSSAAPNLQELLFASIFGKTKTVDAPSSLLPKDFKLSGKEEPSSAAPPKFNIPVGKSDGIPAHLLPKGFKEPETSGNIPAHLLPKEFINTPASSENSSIKPEVPESSTVEGAPFAVSKNPKGLIFPKRIDRPSFLTTTKRTTPVSEESFGAEPTKPTIVNLFDR